MPETFYRKEEVQRKCSQSYVAGLKDGVRRYAWWKDGVQYVGTTGSTLSDALGEIERDYEAGRMSGMGGGADV